MKQRVKNEIEKRLNESGVKRYFNIKMKKTGKTIQVSEDRNIWSGKSFYVVSYVELDNYGYVIKSRNVVIANTIEEVAEFILKEA